MSAVMTVPPEPATETAATVEVSVVMPCLNEARTVGRCVSKALAAIKALGVHGEVIVADNGSTDGSAEIAAGLGARVVRVTQPGYGSALHGGITAARGRYLIMGDADESYDFGELGPFLARLREGDDLVVGNRFRGGIHPRAMPWLHRYVGNPVLSGILNLFFRTPIKDAHCGLRGFRKEAYQRWEMTSPGMEFASEMIVKASLHRDKLSEVPTPLYPDGRDRPPHLRSFRDGWRHLRFLLLMCPFWLYLVPSAILFIGGLVLMAYLTPGPRTVGPVGLDLNTLLLGSMCALVGYQTAWLWAYAKLFGWHSGLLPGNPLPLALFRHANLERGLLLGGVLILVGLGLNLWLVRVWYQHDLGALPVSSTLRYSIWGLTAMLLGGQTISGSFLLGMFAMAPRRVGPHAPRG